MIMIDNQNSINFNSMQQKYFFDYIEVIKSICEKQYFMLKL